MLNGGHGRRRDPHPGTSTSANLSNIWLRGSGSDLVSTLSHGHDAAASVGTSPPTGNSDRAFRPDVEGLRAIAVLLVVLYHAGISRLSGGYVGVDVFFVISGFVITGVLLRERSSTGRTSILAFYGRRCRRILPAATLVIVVTVVMAYVLLGIVADRTSTDGAWAAVFMANFHFASNGTDYLKSLQPPSPLQNFWTLSVEEQFYLVFPTLFVLLAKLRLAIGFRARLALGLTAVIGGSFLLSVSQTGSDPTVAYFSPLTRAWELALGALVAVGSPWLTRLPSRWATTMTWIGLAAIVLAALTFNSHTAYPGSLVGLPVLGTAFVIAGGTTPLTFGAERLLCLWSFRWLGRLSYSLYLWHWPILILATESAGENTLPLGRSLAWLLVALLLSIITYRVVENPVRRTRFLNRHSLASVGMGIGLISLTLAIIAIDSHAHDVGNLTNTTSSSYNTTTTASIENLVTSATKIRQLPPDLDPPVGMSIIGWNYSSPCWANPTETSVPNCIFGDPGGTRSMAVVGDSHAQMWFDTLDRIATRSHWRLFYFAKSFCPAVLLPVTGADGGEYSACDRWHNFVIRRINQIDPDLVLVSEENRPSPNSGSYYSGTQWRDGLADFFRGITTASTKFMVLGNIPMLPQAPPDCLARHPDDIQACSASVAASQTRYHAAEAAAATSVGGRYIDPTPWLCSRICTPVIGHYAVYFDPWHLMGPYALQLTNVLANALRLPASTEHSRGFATQLSTTMLLPRTRSSLTGKQWLNAAASSDVNISSVQFRITGSHLHGLTVTATRTYVGWLAGWNTDTVPNGTYTIQSIARDSAANISYSRVTTVTVDN